MEERNLTKLQKKFCREYVYDLNGARAYQATYKSCKSYNGACVSASQLLRNPKVKEYIEELQSNLQSTVGITKISQLQEYRKKAYSSIAHLQNTWIELKDFESLTDEQKSTIKEIKTKTEVSLSKPGVMVVYVQIKLYDSLKAMERIDKILGFDSPEKIDLKSGGKKLEMLTVKAEDMVREVMEKMKKGKS